MRPRVKVQGAGMLREALDGIAPRVRARMRTSIRRALTDTAGASVKVRYARCTLVSSEPMRCPMCGADVPAHSEHTCSQER
jgi:hypothetical protein